MDANVKYTSQILICISRKNYSIKMIFTLYFLLAMDGRKSIICGSNFWSWDFDGYESFMVPRIWKITLLANGFCVSLIQKQTIANILNLVLYTSIICGCYSKLFIKIGKIVCAQGHTHIQIGMHYETIHFFLLHLKIFRLYYYNKINMHFWPAQKHVTNRI